jgi:hypothetical protein
MVVFNALVSLITLLVVSFTTVKLELLSPMVYVLTAAGTSGVTLITVLIVPLPIAPTPAVANVLIAPAVPSAVTMITSLLAGAAPPKAVPAMVIVSPI